MPKPILVIVESPSKCKYVERYLGHGYKVIASWGHIMKLNSLANIDIENNFACQYDLIPEKAEAIETMRQYINDVHEVILACDSDREGEAICASICRLFNLPIETTKRIIFTEISETAVQHAIRNPTRINMNLVNAQQAREVLDVLVGFTVSPMLWKNVTRWHKASLSAGRCQTPALRLVYDNHLKIKESEQNQKLTYKIIGKFTNMNIKFELNRQFEMNNEVENYLNLCKLHQFIYIGCQSNDSVRQPPEPFTTSRLQQSASNVFNMSPKDTMKCAQELYENGLITYIRTDCKKYSEEFTQLMSRYITSNYSAQYLRQNMNEYIKPLDSEDPHEAIRPVNILVTNVDDNSNISVKGKKIYNLIWKNAVQSCMSPSTYKILTYKITAPNDNAPNDNDNEPNNNEFRCIAENNIFLGWEIINSERKTDETIINYMANIGINQILQYKTIESQFTITGRHGHLTESGLVKMLEDMGIGRPATFASLVDKIQFRKYVEKCDVEGEEITNDDYKIKNNYSDGNLVEVEKKEVKKIIGNEKNKLVITTLGIVVIEYLTTNMDELFNYNYTGEMEQRLDVIAKGGDIWQNLCRDCYTSLERIVKTLEESMPQVFNIQIDDKHSLIIGKYGPVVKVINKKSVSFLKVRDDLNLDELRDKENIKLEDVVESSAKSNASNSIGLYKGKDLYVKKGKYGVYAQWGNETKSLNEEFSGIKVENIQYIDVLRYLEKDGLLDRKKPIGMVRELTNNISIRNGKYGDYVYYKKPRCKNPIFITLNKFEEDHRTCNPQVLLNWLKINHGVKID